MNKSKPRSVPSKANHQPKYQYKAPIDLREDAQSIRDRLFSQPVHSLTTFELLQLAPAVRESTKYWTTRKRVSNEELSDIAKIHGIQNDVLNEPSKLNFINTPRPVPAIDAVKITRIPVSVQGLQSEKALMDDGAEVNVISSRFLKSLSYPPPDKIGSMKFFDGTAADMY